MKYSNFIKFRVILSRLANSFPQVLTQIPNQPPNNFNRLFCILKLSDLSSNRASLTSWEAMIKLSFNFNS